MLVVAGIFAVTFLNPVGIHFKIVNNSNTAITNIKFYTTERTSEFVLDRLEKDATVEDFLSMRKNKAEGTYSIEYTDYKGDQVVRNGFYAKGKPLDEFVRVAITQDTTIFTFSSANVD